MVYIHKNGLCLCSTLNGLIFKTKERTDVFTFPQISCG